MLTLLLGNNKNQRSGKSQIRAMLGYEASQIPSNRARIKERTTWETPIARRKSKLVPLVEYEGTPLGENTTMWNPQPSITAPLSGE